VSAYNVSSAATQPVGQTQPISDRSEAAPQQRTPAQRQMVHGYAAVPVRGGWLVFQL